MRLVSPTAGAEGACRRAGLLSSPHAVVTARADHSPVLGAENTDKTTGCFWELDAELAPRFRDCHPHTFPSGRTTRRQRAGASWGAESIRLSSGPQTHRASEVLSENPQSSCKLLFPPACPAGRGAIARKAQVSWGPPATWAGACCQHHVKGCVISWCLYWGKGPRVASMPNMLVTQMPSLPHGPMASCRQQPAPAQPLPLVPGPVRGVLRRVPAPLGHWFRPGLSEEYPLGLAPSSPYRDMKVELSLLPGRVLPRQAGLAPLHTPPRPTSLWRAEHGTVQRPCQ